MSDSAKKKLIQKKLPFASTTELKKNSPATPTEKTSPNTVKPSRKRKTSNDGLNRNSKKRVTESKENIGNRVEDDSDEGLLVEVAEEVEEVQSIKKADETTPTTVQSESKLHIKLPSHSKLKRKVNMDLKPSKPIEEDEDDSVVYLDEEEILPAKKTKKSERKKKPTSSSRRSRRKQDLNKTKEENEDLLRTDEVVELSDDESQAKLIEQESIDPVKTPEKIKQPSEEPITSIPTKATSPAAEDPDSIHDEIIEMLSDDSERSANKVSNLENDPNKTPTASKIDIKNLTPKQLARRQEFEARRIEKELIQKKEREAREQQRLKEKEQRDEAKRKEKEEKEELRRKEKEERDRKRQRIADQRDEEKRQKEEERKRQVELREEEKRKREDALKKKELDDEVRKKKAAEAFTKFFVPKRKTETSPSDQEAKKENAEDKKASESKQFNFMAFQIRERMSLAPLVRMQISNEQKDLLVSNLNSDKPVSQLYLKELKNEDHKPIKYEKPCITEEKGSDIMIVDELEGAGEDIQIDESKLKTKHRSKYLLFTENRRPAFHGTWRRKSSCITARRPLAHDPKFFDYEVDSDDEWEEEEPGESLHGSDSEKEKDKDGEEDDYDIDNDFMVPHGHLSDEELQQNDDDELIEDNHPEAQKAKLKILQQEFAAEMKKKTEKIKPRLIGCIWMNGDEDEEGCSKIGDSQKKYHCSDIIWRILKAREMMTSADGVKLQENLEPEIPEVEEELEKTPAPKQPLVRAKLDDEHVKDLIKLIHGNTNGRKYLIREFKAYRLKNFHQDPDFQEFSVKSVDEKIQEISAYKTCAKEGPMFNKKCWLVKQEMIQQYYGDEKLPLPNEWNYILQKEVKERKPRPLFTAAELAKKEEAPVEETKQEIAKPIEVEAPTPSPKPIAVKKRVQLLISGPRGQEISQTKKNNMISQYLKNDQNESGSKEKVTSENDVVVID